MSSALSPFLLPILVASLLGSVHCAAMCGGFVCLYAGQSRSPWTHAAYNGGRLVSYLVAGALAGAAGAALDARGSLIGVARPAAVVAGILLVAWGVAGILRSLGVRHTSGLGPPVTTRLMLPFLRATRGRGAIVRAGSVGLISTLLPCGWLYAFVATAAGAGSVRSGMLTMFVFWLGTVPAMLAVGYSLQRLSGRFRQRLPLVTAFAVVALGVLSIAGRLQPSAAMHAAHVAPRGHAVP